MKTVADLIAKLSAYPPEAEIHLIGLEDDWIGDHDLAILQLTSEEYEADDTPLETARRWCEENSGNMLFIDAHPKTEERLKRYMGHLIDEAVEYVIMELLADWPVRDAIREMAEERYYGRLDDEWRNSPAIPNSSHDTNLWESFYTIVIERANKAVAAARGIR